MNSDELFTRCPTCRTVYRTHDEQLAVQAGKVRCGHCRMVFDGRAHLVDLDPELPAAEESAPDGIEAIASEPEPHSGHPAAFEPAAYGDEPVAAAVAQLDPESPEVAPPDLAAEAPADAPAPRDEDVVPYRWQVAPPPRSPRMRWALGTASALLAIALAGQALFQFRNVIAANNPQFRPNLVAACAALGCTIEPLRGRDEITIDSHDLQADPAHQGLLILQVVLRNRASHAVAFPHIELELLDTAGQAQVRRAFAPIEYAGGAADFTRGMPAAAEWNVKLFIDASSVAARGYNLDLFYP